MTITYCKPRFLFFAGKDHAISKTKLNAEIERLKQENEDLRVERHIIKKMWLSF